MDQFLRRLRGVEPGHLRRHTRSHGQDHICFRSRPSRGPVAVIAGTERQAMIFGNRAFAFIGRGHRGAERFRQGG